MEYAGLPDRLSSFGRIVIVGPIPRKCPGVVVLAVDKVAWRGKRATESEGHRPSPTWTPRGTGDDLLYRWIDDLKSMALQSLQLRFCLDQFRFSQHLWRSEDTRRRPTDGPLYRNEFALRGSMGKSPRHIVRVACLIKANMPQRVPRVPEVREHETALCHPEVCCPSAPQVLSLGSTKTVIS